ncbi:aldo/keto reductase [Flagelloscypha sp. PMI_526]|nr:aldo/keto reductase [Flagelloscypha sp. PMI_526]
MVTKVVSLGGTASHIKVVPVSFGLTSMHMGAVQLPDEQCFETLKVAIDAVPEGAKLMLNSGEFYSNTLGTENLEMLSRFFEKYPDLADKTFLSVKGAIIPGGFQVDGSPENLRRSVTKCLSALRGKKKIDMFQCVRVDPSRPVEEVIGNLVKLKEEGLFDHIAVGECSAASLRRACKITPIAAAEIEVSLWSYEEETKKVIATAKEFNVVIEGYSPLGHGFLTGYIKSRDQLQPGSAHSQLDRFSEKNFDHNIKIVSVLEPFAQTRGITLSQLAIAWVHSLGEHVHPLPGTAKKERALENLAAGDIALSAHEKETILSAVESVGVQGGRYNDYMKESLWG